MNEKIQEVFLSNAMQEKAKEFSRLGIVIADIERIQGNSFLEQKFLDYKINTKQDVEAFSSFCLNQVNLYADKLGKSRITLEIEICEHPKGKMTFSELLEKDAPRKNAEKDVLNTCTRYHIELVKEYLETMYEHAFKEASLRGKNAVHFKFFAKSSNILANFSKELNEIKNGVYNGRNLYQFDLGADEMIILLKNKEEGKIPFLRDGVGLLLKKNSNLYWEFI